MTVDSLWAELEQQLLPLLTRYRSRITELPVEVKADRTLLTEADIAVQKLIEEAIRSHEPNAVIIAEEDERTSPRTEVAESGGRVWVVDPIDGTAQFVQPDAVEFCSVVCLLQDWHPASAFLLAPELGVGGTPLAVSAHAASGSVTVNAEPARLAAAQPATRRLSLTRSSGAPAGPADAAAEEAGYDVKIRTTSQSLDMLRTAVDLGGLTDPPMAAFDVFRRERQKVWDGLAGLCLGAAGGLHTCDKEGAPLDLGPAFLGAPEPTFPSTVMGRPETVGWLLDTSRS